jgi:hypothetical protein
MTVFFFHFFQAPSAEAVIELLIYVVPFFVIQLHGAALTEVNGIYPALK